MRGKFTSDRANHRDALHHDTATYAQTLYHHHNEFLPEDLREIKHNEQPAHIMTVRRHAPIKTEL